MWEERKILKQIHPDFPVGSVIFGPTLDNEFNRFINGIDGFLGVDNIKADVAESDDKYTILTEIPGISKDNVKLKWEKNTLVLSVHKEDKTEDKYISEIDYGDFSKSFNFGKDINRKSVETEFENGCLKMIVYKTTKDEPEDIEINI